MFAWRARLLELRPSVCIPGPGPGPSLSDPAGFLGQRFGSAGGSSFGTWARCEAGVVARRCRQAAGVRTAASAPERPARLRRGGRRPRARGSWSGGRLGSGERYGGCRLVARDPCPPASPSPCPRGTGLRSPRAGGCCPRRPCTRLCRAPFACPAEGWASCSHPAPVPRTVSPQPCPGGAGEGSEAGPGPNAGSVLRLLPPAVPPEATRGTSELPAVPRTWHLGAGQPRPPAARLLPRAHVAARAAGAGPSLQGVPARVTCLQVKRLLSECHH